MTLKEWPLQCIDCDDAFKDLAWDNAFPLTCKVCGHNTVYPHYEPKGKAPGIIGDDIPGGVVIRHLGPKPQKFYSKTDIKRAANERGMNWSDDTPTPYKVSWSGKRINEKDQ